MTAFAYAIVSNDGVIRELWETEPIAAVKQWDGYPNTKAGAPHRTEPLMLASQGMRLALRSSHEFVTLAWELGDAADKADAVIAWDAIERIAKRHGVEI